MIDSSDTNRIKLAKNELFKLVYDDELKDATLLILVNKLDLKVQTTEQIVSQIDFDSIPNSKKWAFGVIGKTGEGLKDAMDWFSSQI